MSDTFYADLPAYTRFLDILDDAAYTAVPPDWLILLSDVRGSTQAIQNGRYRQINLVGASSIVAVLNVARETPVPFVFGGDGATLLVPPSLRPAAQEALLATQAMALAAFDLDLRVGILPVGDIAAQQPIRLAKFRPSPHYEQAMFSGGGLSFAERLLKAPYSPYELPPAPDAQADFSGLECRWQDIPGEQGEIISLLALARRGGSQGDHAVYRDLLQALTEIYGEGMAYSPIRRDNIHVTLNWGELAGETAVRAANGRWSKFKHQLGVWLSSFLFRAFLLPFNRTTRSGQPWSRYLELVEETADYRKYDDTLRMILSSSPEQRGRLEAYLTAQRAAGRLAYGLHITDRATLTCLVFERMGRQVHFVDGADGGYALAAQSLQGQLEEGQGRG
jgi:hypothetical protein